jgi:Nucleoside phosphorylase
MNRNSLCCVVQALSSEFVGLKVNNFQTKHIITGFGKVNAAVNLMADLMAARPDFVINIGTAGSFVHRVGDIVVCDRFVDRDLMN